MVMVYGNFTLRHKERKMVIPKLDCRSSIAFQDQQYRLFIIILNFIFTKNIQWMLLRDVFLSVI